MKTTTMRELKHHTAEVVARVEAGEVIELTRRGRPVARLSPVRKRGKPLAPDFEGRLAAIYGDTVLKNTATDLVSEGRGER